MRLTRTVTLPLAVLVGTTWAGASAMVGLWLVRDFAPRHAYAYWPIVILGIGAMALGQYVYMVIVADRLFPRMGRRPGVWAAEMAVFAVFGACLVLSLMTAYWGVLS